VSRFSAISDAIHTKKPDPSHPIQRVNMSKNLFISNSYNKVTRRSKESVSLTWSVNSSKDVYLKSTFCLIFGQLEIK